MIGRRRLVSALATLPWMEAAVATVASPGYGAGTLFTAAGKKPLVRRTFRPPNLETPLADLAATYTANDAFYVRYHLGVIPELDVRAWRLAVSGPSAVRSLQLSLADLRRRFERVSVSAVNQCSGNRRGLFEPRVPGVQWDVGAMGHAVWTGVRLRDVLDAAGLRSDALEVVFDGADRGVWTNTPDYAKSLPIERARDDDTLIAFEMNGQPLPHLNGAPARLVVPGWTATYWVKHLTEIRILPRAFDGYWMRSAYRVPSGVFAGARFASQESVDSVPVTEILVNSLVTSHRTGDRVLRAQPDSIRGWAWDGGSGIRAVEVTVDEGRTWRNATLTQSLGRYAWRGFAFPLNNVDTGRRRIQVRAISNGGARQPDSLTPNPAGYHHNRVQSLELQFL